MTSRKALKMQTVKIIRIRKYAVTKQAMADAVSFIAASARLQIDLAPFLVSLI